jgi:hypothetical protein
MYHTDLNKSLEADCNKSSPEKERARRSLWEESLERMGSIQHPTACTQQLM